MMPMENHVYAPNVNCCQVADSRIPSGTHNLCVLYFAV